MHFLVCAGRSTAEQREQNRTHRRVTKARPSIRAFASDGGSRCVEISARKTAPFFSLARVCADEDCEHSRKLIVAGPGGGGKGRALTHDLGRS